MSTQPAHSEIETETRSQQIARRLRGQMAERNLKQGDIAQAIGKSQPVVSDRLRGNMAFEINELDLIEEATGISADYLWSGQQPARRTKISGGPLEGAAAKKESFLSESNRRPFHYKRDGSVVIPFPSRPGLTEESAAGGHEATIINFPGRAAA